MPKTQKGYGPTIREARNGADLSLKDLASRVDISFNHLSFVEREMRSPSTKLCLRIAEELDLDSDHLLSLAGHAPPDVVDLIAEQPSLAEEVRRMAEAS